MVNITSIESEPLTPDNVEVGDFVTSRDWSSADGTILFIDKILEISINGDGYQEIKTQLYCELDKVQEHKDDGMNAYDSFVLDDNSFIKVLSLPNDFVPFSIFEGYYEFNTNFNKGKKKCKCSSIPQRK